MITRETDYAIRALLCLARRAPGEVISASVMAEEMEIPYRFLRRIVLKLSEEGFVTTLRGKYGGMRLAKAPATITLLEVMRAADPDAITLNLCLANSANCSRSASCVVHDELAEIQAQFMQRLSAVTLATLLQREQTAGQQRIA